MSLVRSDIALPPANTLRPHWRSVLKAPLPHMSDRPATRLALRLVNAALASRVLEVRGMERLENACDPFIVAINHSQRLEAVTIPTTLFVARGGKLIHFIADWNFMLIPGVGMIMRMGQTIPLAHKDARPRWLNVFRERYRIGPPAFVKARELIEAGHSIGVFPEGTVNRDPGRLLPGHGGAARLALETGAAIVPAGVRFPLEPRGAPIGALARLSLHVGSPIRAERASPGTRPSRAAVLALHETVMREIGQLSGKARGNK
jgi:1-acyl-sn-glycerol-3-phosphate acyltransferase